MNKKILVGGVVLLAVALLGVGAVMFNFGKQDKKEISVEEKYDLVAVVQQTEQDLSQVDFTPRSTIANKPFSSEGLYKSGYVPLLNAPIAIYTPNMVFDRYQLVEAGGKACRIDIGGSIFVSPEYPDLVELIEFQRDKKSVPASIRLVWSDIEAGDFSKWGFLFQIMSVEATSSSPDGFTRVYLGNPFNGKATAVVKGKQIISLDMTFIPSMGNYQILKRVYNRFEELTSRIASQGSVSFGGIQWRQRMVPREYWSLAGYRIGGIKAYNLRYLDDYPIIKGELLTWADIPVSLVVWLQGKDQKMVDAMKERINELRNQLQITVEENKGLYKVVVTDPQLEQIVNTLMPSSADAGKQQEVPQQTE